MNGIIPLAIVVISAIGWVTHLITTARAEEWVFFTVGFLFPPIGAINGFLIWFE